MSTDEDTVAWNAPDSRARLSSSGATQRLAALSHNMLAIETTVRPKPIHVISGL
jgi:hypothetical protein